MRLLQLARETNENFIIKRCILSFESKIFNNQKKKFFSFLEKKINQIHRGDFSIVLQKKNFLFYKIENE